MTDQQTDLSPRELDAALARRLFPWNENHCRVCGWPLVADVNPGCHADGCSQRPPPKVRADEPATYSTTGDGMLLVLDAMPAMSNSVGTIRVYLDNDGKRKCTVAFMGPGRTADTIPRAVALAALAALPREHME